MIVSTIHDKYTEELMLIMRKYDSLAQGTSDLLPLKRAMNRELLAACQKHKREFDWQAGEQVEPETHTGVVVVSPKGGMAG